MKPPRSDPPDKDKEDEEWEPDRDPARDVPWGVRGRSVTRTDLVRHIAATTGESKSVVNDVLDALFTTMAESVSSGTKVSIPGWLAVERTHRAARTGRNPQTGEAIHIPAGYSVKVTAGSKLKAAPK